ncbi:uncharacterized protein LOC122386049 isoform X1 [Amphibalanus amphitrite]|uniref:uncharacterized protein LOC122386049 isoform X1 n=2 Tax=Amphibalanus amphitrite TaxID=1232801 RepID=UPI001C913A77|nr:uncharacterized protein LOC122386049 isoform X1 [Amphibalanus amphitrite]
MNGKMCSGTNVDIISLDSQACTLTQQWCKNANGTSVTRSAVMSPGSDDGAQPPCPRSPSPPRYAALGGDSYMSRSRHWGPNDSRLPPTPPATSFLRRVLRRLAWSTLPGRFLAGKLLLCLPTHRVLSWLCCPRPCSTVATSAAKLPAAELRGRAASGRALRPCSAVVLCGRASRGWALRGPVIVAAARVPRPARCRAVQ